MALVSRNFLKIVSYNCNSIRSKVEVIRNLLNLCDILICQEVILLPDQGHILSGITAHFGYVFVPSTFPESNHGDGRPVGGMVLFYKLYLSISCRTVFRGPHFCLFEVESCGNTLNLASIYLPCDRRTDESLVRYQQTLGELQAVIDNLDCGNFVAIGDFNACPNRGRSWRFLSEFANENSLEFKDLSLPNDSFA